MRGILARVPYLRKSLLEVGSEVRLVASCGAACIYIVVNEVGAFMPVSSPTATVLQVETQGQVYEHRQRQTHIAHPRLIPYVEPQRRTAMPTEKWFTPNTRRRMRSIQSLILGLSACALIR